MGSGGMLMFNSKVDKRTTYTLLLGRRTGIMLCSNGSGLGPRRVHTGVRNKSDRSLRVVLKALRKSEGRRLLSGLSLIMVDPKIPASLPVMGRVHRGKLPV